MKILRFVYDHDDVHYVEQFDGTTFPVNIYAVETGVQVWCGELNITYREWAVLRSMVNSSVEFSELYAPIPTTETVPNVRRTLCSNHMMYDAEGNMIGRD